MSILSPSIYSQVYDNHFGTGNDVGVTVSSSAEDGNNEAANTLNGTGYLPDMEGASRFLAQAGFGGSYEDAEYVTEIGIKPWLEEQFDLPYTSFLDSYYETFGEVTELIQTVYSGAEIPRLRAFTDIIFWNKALRDESVLRSKAAFALNQIFVLSTRSPRLADRGYGGSDYYDIFYEGGFGNFRDILEDVTMHPLMGYYLSHFNNRKGNPELGTLPDENYAREIMQLFTIGLYELNNNGTYKLDTNGERIPTYDIEDIQELAKVFTGFSGGAWNVEAFPNLAGVPLNFGGPIRAYDARVPMIIYPEHHDVSSKIMINGTVLPAGQSGMQDVNDALDILFNHPNVGPFIATRLIQQMVKSNPTPAYVNRVATVFNNNGQGVRGDMRAVFKTILSDTEARECSWIQESRSGKLRQPLERFIMLFKAFDIDSPSGKLWMLNSNDWANEQEQAFMGAPTVFNYFTPFYAEEEHVAPNDMVSPAFQILHSVTAIHYINWLEDTMVDRPFNNFTAVNNNELGLNNNNSDIPFLDFTDEIEVLENEGLPALLDRINLILCHGELKSNSRTIIENALTEMIEAGITNSETIVKSAVYFTLVTADFVILK